MTTLTLSHATATTIATATNYSPYNFKLNAAPRWAHDDLVALQAPEYVIELQDEETRHGTTGNVIATISHLLTGRHQIGTFHHSDITGILTACNDEHELVKEWINKHF